MRKIKRPHNPLTKVLIRLFQNFPRLNHKSFDQTFSKVCAGRGREALVAPAGAKPFHAVFASFCGFLHKKKGNGLRSVSRNKTSKAEPSALRGLIFPFVA
ncbi:MAG: hypothetical protein J6S28_00420 [Clostridia bacterium]|nr:hypothetical protein [Clostridia bacterium]